MSIEVVLKLALFAIEKGAGWAVRRARHAPSSPTARAPQQRRQTAAPANERGQKPDGSYGRRSAAEPSRPAATPASTPAVDASLPAVALANLIRDGAYVCVDSNIWLDQRFWQALDAMVTSLASSQTPLVMAGEQLEEIDRLRNSEDRELASRASRVNRFISEACKRQGMVVREVRDPEAARDFDSFLVMEVRGYLKVRRSLARALVVTEDVKLTTRLHSQAAMLKREPATLVVLTGAQFAKWMG